MLDIVMNLESPSSKSSEINVAMENNMFETDNSLLNMTFHYNQKNCHNSLIRTLVEMQLNRVASSISKITTTHN